MDQTDSHLPILCGEERSGGEGTTSERGDKGTCQRKLSSKSTEHRHVGSKSNVDVGGSNRQEDGRTGWGTQYRS